MFNNNIRLNHGTGCDEAPVVGPFNRVPRSQRVPHRSGITRSKSSDGFGCDPESRKSWVCKNIKSRAQSCLCLACSGCPFKRRQQPQAAVLSESDIGSDGVKPALSFVIQNHQTSCSMQCPICMARY